MRRGGRPEHLFLLVSALAASGGSAPRAAAEEPWTIEGESLRGSRAGGTELERPRITQGSLVITALTGRLDATRNVIFLRDSLDIVDGLRHVRSQEGTYRRADRLLDLIGDVRGEGPEGRVTAGRLIFDRARGLLQLRDNPFVADSLRDIWARTIDYDERAGVARGDGDVRIFSRRDSTWIFGEHAVLERAAGRISVTGRPRIERAGGAPEDRLVVHADTLLWDDARASGEARGNVQFTRGTVRATGTHARLVEGRERVLLWGDPVAWEEDGVIWADTLLVQQGEPGVDWLRAVGAVRVRYRSAAAPDEENLILGDTLVARLERNALSDLEVRGDAWSVYLPSWEDARAGSGRNMSSARLIRVDLRGGRAERVELRGEGQGVYLYPSEASRRRLDRGGAVDSLRLAHSDRFGAADTMSPTLPGLLAHLAANRSLDLPDSLRSPADSLFDERVEYEGDTIRFVVDEDRMLLLGSAEIRYGRSALLAPRIEYIASRDLVKAEGGAKLKDGDGEVTGDRMTYRTDEEQGFVYQGRTAFEGGFYRGEEIKKLTDEILLVRDGDYTTCDHQPPHFYFHAEEMKLIQDDKVIARPVVLHILDIPVLALPYWFFPTTRERRSGLLLPDLELGVNRNRGRFFRNLGYYWAISDHMDARGWVDYIEGSRELFVNGNFRYDVRYLLDGSVDASYLDDRGDASRRYSVRGFHQQTLGEGATLTGRADFTSDEDFRTDQDFGAGVDERLNRTLKSNLSFRKSWSRANLSADASRTEYLDERAGDGVKLQQSLPSLDLSLGQRAIGRAADDRGRGGKLAFLSSLYFSSAWSYRNVYSKRYGGEGESKQAASERHSLTDTRTLGPYLRLSPSLQTTGAWFDRDNRGERHGFGATWSASAQASTALYGTFPVSAGPLAGVRHVIEPSVSYSYSPEFPGLTYADSSGVERPLFPSVGGIALGGAKASSVSFSLSQRLHLKFRRGEKVWKQENLATWSTGVSHNFEARRPARPWSSISNSIRLRPWSRADVSYSIVHGAYDRRPQSSSLTTSLRLDEQLFQRAPGDTAGRQLDYGEFGEVGLSGTNLGNRETTSAPGGKWSATIGHSFRKSRGDRDPTHTIDLGVDRLQSGRWTAGGRLYYDLEEKRPISHSFTLQRDLHCWQARFEYRRSGDLGEYYFQINVKELPELQYKRDNR